MILEISKYKSESKVCMPITMFGFVLFGFLNIKSLKI